jgi:RimJ/RimL family protein N-acetyltransferase
MFAVPAQHPTKILGAAPPLETERLRLRQFRADDLIASHAMWNEPAIAKFMASGKPQSVEDIWKGILQTIGHWQVVGYGYWAIEEKASGRFVGNVGYGDFRRAMVPDMNETPEAGWAFVTEYHRRGYGTEALAVVTAWGDAHLPQAKTACIIAPDNVASIALATKFGFHEVAQTTYKDEPTLLLHRDRGFVPRTPE